MTAPSPDPDAPAEVRDAVDVLARTPAVLAAMLRGLDEPWTMADEGPGTWSPHAVVAHLVHGERTDWIVRARIILEHPGATFEPFDRRGHEAWWAGRSTDDIGVHMYLFTDIGQVYGDKEQLALRNMTESFGTGLRVASWGRFVGRAEIAFSDEGTQFRLRADQVFQPLRLNFRGQDAIGAYDEHETFRELVRVAGGFRFQLPQERGQCHRAGAEAEVAQGFASGDGHVNRPVTCGIDTSRRKTVPAAFR